MHYHKKASLCILIESIKLILKNVLLKLIIHFLKFIGKVLIHCIMGISRSATIAIAYLMIKKRFKAKEAVEKVKKARDIKPNNGFLKQLVQLDNDKLQC